ncbi:MAG TPA: hypothetical protein VGI53_12065 [Dyella sp.]
MKRGHFQGAHNALQAIVEVMGNAASELAYGFDLLTVVDFFVRFAQALLQRSAAGDVTQDQGEAEQGSIAMMDGVDDQLGGKVPAVRAHHHAFHFNAPGLGRTSQESRQHAARAITLIEEQLAGLAANVPGLKTGHPLRATIPIDNQTIRIDQADGSVGHTAGKQAKAPLAFA